MRSLFFVVLATLLAAAVAQESALDMTQQDDFGDSLSPAQFDEMNVNAVDDDVDSAVDTAADDDASDVAFAEGTCGGSNGCTDPNDHVYHSSHYGVGFNHDLQDYVLHGEQSDKKWQSEQKSGMVALNKQGKMSDWARMHIMEAKLIAPEKITWQCWWLKYLAGKDTAAHWCPHLHKYHIEHHPHSPRDNHDELLSQNIRAIREGHGVWHKNVGHAVVRHVHHHPYDTHTWHGHPHTAPFDEAHVYHHVALSHNEHGLAGVEVNHFHSHAHTHGALEYHHAVHETTVTTHHYE
jgi:hypothetical protein